MIWKRRRYFMMVEKKKMVPWYQKSGSTNFLAISDHFLKKFSWPFFLPCRTISGRKTSFQIPPPPKPPFCEEFVEGQFFFTPFPPFLAWWRGWWGWRGNRGWRERRRRRRKRRRRRNSCGRTDQCKMTYYPLESAIQINLLHFNTFCNMNQKNFISSRWWWLQTSTF